MGLPTSFHRFSDLSTAIRDRIWALAAGEPLFPTSRRMIPLRVQMIPRLSTVSEEDIPGFDPEQDEFDGDGVYIRWHFRVFGPGPAAVNAALWHSSTDSYRFYLRRNPNYIQMRDHVFCSPWSLFVLWMYARERDPVWSSFDPNIGGLGPSEEQRGRDLVGFDRIRVLETSLPSNVQGLRDDMFLIRNIFTYRSPAGGRVRVAAGTAFSVARLYRRIDWVDAFRETIYQLLAPMRFATRTSDDPDMPNYYNSGLRAADGALEQDGQSAEMLPVDAWDEFDMNVRVFLAWSEEEESGNDTQSNNGSSNSGDSVVSYSGEIPSRDVIWLLFSFGRYVLGSHWVGSYPIVPPSVEELLRRAALDIAIRERGEEVRSEGVGVNMEGGMI
ncbi:uncharacterized protein LY89DRAFT_766916 [Mollisia scopiformis]|uniref:Uncharacterized protein n=1 Tax=Mollisia scopiformis TaxID=149040 RepID=A0A132B4E1_MOLSC|nr:uncharacterized protein LY89DRAFT_766916 [Mollisia scopiformis]KUJ07103.1 hypothetical protein LY89DRAFT_766916 [Mollisia scopiformis]